MPHPHKITYLIAIYLLYNWPGALLNMARYIFMNSRASDNVVLSSNNTF